VKIYVSANHLAQATEQTNPIELAIQCKFQGWIALTMVQAPGPLVVVQTGRGDLMADFIDEKAMSELENWRTGKSAMPFWIELNYTESKLLRG